MARPDHIAEAKEVAQIGACIGREFDQALVEAVAERPAAVGPAIAQLVAAELVSRRRDLDNPRFGFKHALLQEAVCESLLRGKRQAIHARILEALDAGQSDIAPEILAHHAARAGRTDAALAHWQHAGKLALDKSALAEAAGFFEHAIGLIHQQADAVDRRALELELQLQLGQAQIGARGHTDEATKRTFERALELIETVPSTAAYRAQVYYGVWA